MNSQSKVTIYIPCYNYGRFLKEAIESVLRQTYQNWELFLIDENSNDNTLEVMQLYKDDSRIKIFQTDNIGLPGTANLAINESNGDYIIRLDADDIFDENNLLVLSNYLDLNSDIAIVFPDYYLMDESGSIFSQERKQPFYLDDHSFDIPPNGASVMARKTILKNIGGYRTDLGAQDGLDLWTKIIKDHKCGNVNLPLFYYRKHANNLTKKTSHIIQARQKIKQDIASEYYKDFQPIIAVIPCRENYDFIKNLWSQKINEKTLLEIALDKCVKSKVFSHIIIASDTDEVKIILKKYKDSRITFFQRSLKSTNLSQPVAKTLESAISEFDPKYKGLCFLAAVQAPFIKTETIEETISNLLINDSDSSILVKEIDSPVFQKSAHGLSQLNYKSFIMNDFDTLYLHTRTCVVTKNKNLRNGSLTGANIVSTITSKEETIFISNHNDLEYSKFFYNNNKS
tara:strand:+ start:1318 stop:2685 length:1368 start_codon:yes stop_codon:yes gene_type:complete